MPVLRKEDIHISDHYVAIQTDSPMKVVSSAVHNPGFGFYTHLMNRSVPYTYDERKPQLELQQFCSLRAFRLTIQLR